MTGLRPIHLDAGRKKRKNETGKKTPSAKPSSPGNSFKERMKRRRRDDNLKRPP